MLKSLLTVLLLTTAIPQVLDNYNLQTLKKEFRLFMKKYESNSCIMNIFKNFQNQCEEIDDAISSKIAYKMTLCTYKSLNKEIINCNIDIDHTCVKQLEGDSWTTFITFTQHIDNLCFYYKTLVWEKSSEFLFAKLLNSSLSVLKELTESANLAERILTFQQDFSAQLNDNLVETVDKFKNINSFLENYAKLEDELKSNINALEVKLNSNNEKVANMVEYFNGKFEMLQNVNAFLYNDNGGGSANTFYFFSALLVIVWLLTFLDSLSNSRLLLFSLVVIFFLIEKYYINVFLNKSPFDITQVYYILLFYCLRFAYVITIAVVLYLNYSKHVKAKNEVALMYSDCRSYFNITPAWMRKYFTRMKLHNEGLLEKFRAINKIIENEDFSVYSE
jgi:hypothetical protein